MTHLSVTIFIKEFECLVDFFSEIRFHFSKLHHRNELVERYTPAAIEVHLGERDQATFMLV